jgi:hypothetical protein
MSKFSLGQTVVTRGIAEELENPEFAKFVNESFVRHANGDWGDMCEEDKEANEYALENELRLFSAYKKGDWKIWIITEWDRSVTTALFPDEY